MYSVYLIHRLSHFNVTVTIVSMKYDNVMIEIPEFCR